jgi:hypothetical protein
MSTRLKDPAVWIYGLIAAFIGGGSSAVASTLTASFIAPDKFNVGAQLGNFLKLAGATFVVSGVFHAFSYLKQSPLPPIEEETK